MQNSRCLSIESVAGKKLYTAFHLNGWLCEQEEAARQHKKYVHRPDGSLKGDPNIRKEQSERREKKEAKKEDNETGFWLDSSRRKNRIKFYSIDFSFFSPQSSIFIMTTIKRRAEGGRKFSTCRYNKINYAMGLDGTESWSSTGPWRHFNVAVDVQLWSP